MWAPARATDYSEPIPGTASFQTHREHIHYGNTAKRGAPSGSGSVESLGRQFQHRFKRTGQYWIRPGFSHLIARDVLVRNQDFDYLGNRASLPSSHALYPECRSLRSSFPDAPSRMGDGKISSRLKGLGCNLAARHVIHL